MKNSSNKKSKTLDTPNKKIIYDNISKTNVKNNNNKQPIENEKIRIEMSYEQARELLDRPESNRTIILPSGAKVCLSESGDPNGTPVIMMSGMGMHSRKYALLLNNYGLKYNKKIIGFDRPNIDGSDPIYFKEPKNKNKNKKVKSDIKFKKSEKDDNINNRTKRNSKLSSCSNESDITLVGSPIVDRINTSEHHFKTSINVEMIRHRNSGSTNNDNDIRNENTEINNIMDITNPDENHNINNDGEKPEKKKKGQIDLKVYAEWVEAIIDALDIKRCYLMSLCIGGLYVLGCVKYFKHPEKIANPVYLIAPWAKPSRCIFPIRVIKAVVPTPVIRASMSCYFKTVGLIVPDAEKSPNALLFKLLHVDKKADPLGGRRLLFSKVLKSGFFRNETKHLCHDDWELGFRINPNNKLDFSTIEKDVMIYHGTKDKLIPSKSSRYLVKVWNSNYNAELHIKKGKDHSTIKGSCLHDIFRSIVEHDQAYLESIAEQDEIDSESIIEPEKIVNKNIYESITTEC